MAAAIPPPISDTDRGLTPTAAGGAGGLGMRKVTGGRGGAGWQQRLLAVLLPEPEAWSRHARAEAQAAEAGVHDLLLSRQVDATRPIDADTAFDRLRWGGRLVCVDENAARLCDRAAAFSDRDEWRLEDPHQLLPPAAVLPVLRWLPGALRRRLAQRPLHFTSFRKVLLDPPARLTARHSYDVRLVPARGRSEVAHATDGQVVLKRVPTYDQARARLEQTCPGVPADRLEQIVRKLVDKVFPVFLTREAAFLKLLQRDLPEAYRPRTPRVLSLQTDEQGLVRAMTVRWLRQGGPTLSQSELAVQSARLLRELHDRVGIMHLDLRLDNMVVTRDGVGVVDFGSAVRIGEDLSANPMLQRLIREMLEASQITADLRRQRDKGLIRGAVFAGLPFPPTPAFDLYALVTNLTRPHDHAEFRGLIRHDRSSAEGQWFSKLRRRVLRPGEGQRPIVDAVQLLRVLKASPHYGDAAGRAPRLAESPATGNAKRRSRTAVEPEAVALELESEPLPLPTLGTRETGAGR